MSDRESLLGAVYDAPDDDAPRLVYADWLDEHDDPDRAEFIRLQVRLARMPWSDPGRRTGEERAAELLRQHRTRWLGDLAAHPGEWEFDRGFADRLTWDRHPPSELEAVLRLIESPGRVPPDVRLTRFVTHFPTERLAGLVAECPAAEHLRSLGLFGTANRRYQVGLLRIVWGSHLSRLEDLDLDGNRYDDTELHLLAWNSQLRSLKRLNLNPSTFSHRVFGQFLAAPEYRGLADLGLNGCELDRQHLAAFARLKAFLNVTTFRLSDCSIAADGMEALASAPFVPELRVLDLSQNRLYDQGAAAVAHAPWDRLEHLDLTGNHITDAGARALAESPTLGRLRRLILRNNPIGEAGVAALAKRFPHGLVRL